MSDIVATIQALLVEEHGLEPAEADRLIGKFPTIVAAAVARGGWMPSVNAAAQALLMADCLEVQGPDS